MPLDSVRQLLAEKAKFEKWLTDLDAKRATTPVHVFDRVRGDYSSRLQGVTEKLKVHTDALQQHAASLARKLAELTGGEQEITDARAESELRAQVGELSPAEWDKTSKKLERDLAKIKQDQALIDRDLESLRDVLGSFDAPRAPAAAAPSQNPEPAAAAPDPGSNVDELAFLKSVIGTTPQAAPAARPEPASSPPPTSGKSSSPTPVSVPATGATRSQPTQASPARRPAEGLVAPVEPGPVLKARDGEEPLAMHVTGSNPIVLRSSGVVEQPKTLKCGECSAMNYPSEWYCERCGAELVSV